MVGQVWGRISPWGNDDDIIGQHQALEDDISLDDKVNGLSLPTSLSLYLSISLSLSLIISLFNCIYIYRIYWGIYGFL